MVTIPPTVTIAGILFAAATGWLIAAVNNSSVRWKCIVQSVMGGLCLIAAAVVLLWDGLEATAPGLFSLMARTASNPAVWVALFFLIATVYLIGKHRPAIVFPSRTKRMAFVIAVMGFAGLFAWALSRNETTGATPAASPSVAPIELLEKEAQNEELRGKLRTLEAQIQEANKRALDAQSGATEPGEIEDLQKQIAQLQNQVADWRKQALEFREKLGSRSAQRPIPPTYDEVSQELMQFYQGYAVPADQDLTPMLNISSGQSELDALLPRYLDLQVSVAQAQFLSAYNHDLLAYGDFGELFGGFCRYVAAYREKKKWLYKLGELSGHPELVTDHPTYKRWLMRDELLQRQLLERAGQAPFSRLRDCVAD